jgi:PPK2 family polyphosphate:nucleotide phosphotransferase
MKADNYLVDGSRKVDIRRLATNAEKDDVDKKDILEEYARNKEEMIRMQDVMRADAKEGLIVVVQALDASGKDSIISHVFSGLNPQGINVYSYKAPSSEELAHDYLWRIHRDLPRRGEIAVLNRSHYEDLVTVDVQDIWPHYKMADRVYKDKHDAFFKKRYEQVRNFEEYLYENSYRMVKIFLHVSRKEEAVQLKERIDTPEKNWKFRADDLKVLDQYDDFLKCFDRVINATGTPHSPWYVLPGDDRWYTRWLLSEIVLDQMHQCDPSYPELSPEEKEKLPRCRETLNKVIEDAH